MKKRGFLKGETELLQPEIEVCLNPWNGVCDNSDIFLYIVYEGRRLPICRKCWSEIASANVEWRYS